MAEQRIGDEMSDQHPDEMSDQPVVSQPDPETQPDVEPLPAPDVPAGQPPLAESSVDGPGLSPLAHNPDLITDTPESAPTQQSGPDVFDVSNNERTANTDEIPPASDSAAPPDLEPSSETGNTAADGQQAPPWAPKGDRQPPANTVGRIETGLPPLHAGDPAAVECPVCQHRFIPEASSDPADMDGATPPS
jgi:hypothetical protein